MRAAAIGHFGPPSAIKVLERPVRVPIAAVLPLTDATQAHRRLAGGGIVGRMALRVRPG